jgi:hypothetical protein
MPIFNTCPTFAEGSAARISGTRSFKSASRFVGACNTKTARLNWDKFCWNDKMRSTVMKTSNPFSASFRISPFFKPAQPILGTVSTE